MRDKVSHSVIDELTTRLHQMQTVQFNSTENLN